MQDHSHKFFFLAATGVMCAAAMYGSQAGPSLLLPLEPPQFLSAEASMVASQRPHGLAQAVSFTASDVAQKGETAAANESGPPGNATVVPNSTSCPESDASALVSPPSVNGAIGSPKPAEGVSTPNDASLGTGSSCPPARKDAGIEVKSLPLAAIAAQPGATNHP